MIFLIFLLFSYDFPSFLIVSVRLFLRFPKFSHGFRMFFSWFSSDSPDVLVVFVSFSYDFLNFLIVLYDFLTISLIFLWFSIFFSWISYDFPDFLVVFVRFSRCFPTIFLIFSLFSYDFLDFLVVF